MRMMHRNKSVSSHSFAMVPRADIPRAAFNMEKTYKTTFDAGLLIPVLCEEVLPGDSFNVRMTAFCRLATPIFPLMDNLRLDSFFFYVPNRLVWNNWVKFMGEQDNPADSISFTVPTLGAPAAGVAVGSVFDYFGWATLGQPSGGNNIFYNVLPLRMYNLIWNQWFRDENLQNSAVVNKGDSGDANADFTLLRRGKRHDYFTSCLPWPQKGGTAVTLPLGTTAPVIPSGVGSNIPLFRTTGDAVAGRNIQMTSGTNNMTITGATFGANQAVAWDPAAGATRLVADLSQATAATINQLRQAFQIQRLLERDARGGTRYTEIVRSHFGVVSPDSRLDRAEYLGGGSTPIVVSPVAQTSSTGLTGGTTPLGNLAGIATGLASDHGFSQSFTEHGYIIGLVSVRADLTYQQGVRRHWNRRTRYDFYFPAFAHLGEQAVLNREIFAQGSAPGGADDQTFGFQERWAEYRYTPSEITGLFRSTSAGTLDAWHLAQRFTVAPVLGNTFIQETPPLSRVLAVGAAANGAQLIFDSYFNMRVARPMPLYSVPGLIDHF